MTITTCPTDLAALVADLDDAVRSYPRNDVETVDAVCAALRPALSAARPAPAGAPGRRPRGVPIPPAPCRTRRRVLPGGARVAARTGHGDPRPPRLVRRRRLRGRGARDPLPHHPRGSPRGVAARRSRSPATSPACCPRATSTGSTTSVTRRRSRCTCTAPTCASAAAAASGGATPSSWCACREARSLAGAPENRKAIPARHPVVGGPGWGGTGSRVRSGPRSRALRSSAAGPPPSRHEGARPPPLRARRGP